MEDRHHVKKVKSLGKGNKISQCFDEQDNQYSHKEIIKSWKNGYKELVTRDDNEKGLRLPQFGALSAIRAHWVTSNAPATIVLPTGTGKTETMFATIASERIVSTLIIVPSNFLREQIFEGASNFGVMPKLGMIENGVIYPTTFLYKAKFEDQQKLIDTISISNIIVTTPGMIKSLNKEVLDFLVKKVNVVIFDEAHHLGAADWLSVREKFKNKKILQFTATPFRNDGKKIPGKIIFNYGLGLAQEAGYFKQIEFFPIEEYDESKSDLKIAENAVKLLRKDIKDGYEHVVLARAKNTKRADELFEQIYSKYEEFKPVVIHSNKKISERRESLEKVKNGTSKIVVCVNMFGEGIDIPTLKIAAIHDKYKSLPVTLQFIGRFARTSGENLGNAKLVTNIAIEDLRESVENLYQQDSDWNKLLNIHSSQSIEREIEEERFLESFEKGHIGEINLSQIKMKVSTRMFLPNTSNIIINNWKKVLNPDRTTSFINEKDSIYIFIEEIETKVAWSNQKDIVQYEYDFFVIYYDEDNEVIHINETDARKGNSLISKIFPDSSHIKGEPVFRALDGINRLMLGTLGLKKIPQGNVSFRMFAGTDIRLGISEAVSSSSTKSNLFGYGFKEGDKISIGCSYNGKIWMRWVEGVDFWITWCKAISKKVQDSTIDTKHILENCLVLETITKFPNGIPYKITLPENVEVSKSLVNQLYIENEKLEIPFFQAELRNPKLNDKNLSFECWVNDRKYVFEQYINNRSYGFKQVSGDDLLVKQGNNLISMVEYLEDNSPEISFIQENGSVTVIQENLQTVIQPKKDMELNSEYIKEVDWEQYGVDIKKESQGRNKKINSIQYATIHNIVDSKSDIIFDDDGSGEIADIVTILINKKQKHINFHLYHCKYSSAKTPGARVSDLYEVCGQAEKSIVWNDNSIELIDRLIHREKQQQNNYDTSRIDKGDLKTLHIIKKMIRAGFQTTFNISIVQPGVSIDLINSSMNQILLASDSYLTDTYGIKLNCYFSK